jgi:hypothetical protein
MISGRACRLWPGQPEKIAALPAVAVGPLREGGPYCLRAAQAQDAEQAAGGVALETVIPVTAARSGPARMFRENELSEPKAPAWLRARAHRFPETQETSATGPVAISPISFASAIVSRGRGMRLVAISGQPVVCLRHQSGPGLLLTTGQPAAPSLYTPPLSDGRPWRLGVARGRAPRARQSSGVVQASWSYRQ